MSSLATGQNDNIRLEASYLQGKNEAYTPKNLIDGDRRTWWTPDGDEKSGRHARVKMFFKEADSVAGFEIMGGSRHPDYPGYGNIYSMNNRMAECQLILGKDDDTLVINFFVPDVDKKQYLVWYEFNPVTYAELHVITTHNGSKWNDLAISEFRPVKRITAPMEDRVVVRERIRIRKGGTMVDQNEVQFRTEMHHKEKEGWSQFLWGKIDFQLNDSAFKPFIFNGAFAFRDLAGIDQSALEEADYEEDGDALSFGLPEVSALFDSSIVFELGYYVDGTCASGYSIIKMNPQAELENVFSVSGTCSEPRIIDGKFYFDNLVTDLASGVTEEYDDQLGNDECIGGVWLTDSLYALFYTEAPGYDNIFLYKFHERELIHSYSCDCFDHGLYTCPWSEYDSKTNIWKMGSMSQNEYTIINLDDPKTVKKQAFEQ